MEAHFTVCAFAIAKAYGRPSRIRTCDSLYVTQELLPLSYGSVSDEIVSAFAIAKAYGGPSRARTYDSLLKRQVL